MSASSVSFDGEVILNSVSSCVFVVDEDGVMRFVNTSGEQLLQASAPYLTGRSLDEFIPGDSPILALIQQARLDQANVSENGVNLESPRLGKQLVNAHASPLIEDPSMIILTLTKRSLADQIARQLKHRSAARTITAMSAMLAHEIKNPLSGIRGAAQLLETTAPEDDKALTRLITDETDRICALVDRMESFSDGRPIKREAINIHQVLEHVRHLAQNGFGKHVRFLEQYDPSLPPVFGNKDTLIQIVLNLIKNACEAAQQENAEITITTAYQHGVRLAVPGSNTRVHLPLMVSIQDNGPGIPEDLRSQLFEPFVTTKAKGSGLGLALVAKMIGDHGGLIECESEPKKTIFRIMLPMYSEKIHGPLDAQKEKQS
ncbi:Nitrogen regulation protein NtrB [Candidatus Terasakiella magnetica]|uniref:histidine kinase n=1 Tax=Candidatus Terasakiella magnetica TaxID=1867952 RepID=A0A1C3RD08_9PROT|nr:ATP-binding protein [Candidatus Terasakiella magnetica]SCA55166.1 Nitrogen regulation protein NtrB [Candidatus Terasakiella magnetica]